jgi:hypothetical protein
MQQHSSQRHSFLAILNKVKSTIDIAKLKKRLVYQNPTLAGRADSILDDYCNFFALNARNVILGNGDTHS